MQCMFASALLRMIEVLVGKPVKGWYNDCGERRLSEKKKKLA